MYPCEDDCDHIDYDLDILTGCAWCNDCSHSWLMTTEQLRRHERLQRKADQAWEQLYAETENPIDECGGPVDPSEIPF